MRADDLDHKELLELEPEGGVIRFAGRRALLLDAMAMGLHRKYLVENFGTSAARTVLTQFGFAHGWSMAEAMQSEFKWVSDEEWSRAGIYIHALGGLFGVEPGHDSALSKNGLMLVSSYEAEQHLLHFGRAEVPTCWTICGLISGYLSRSSGTEIYVLEDRCMGHGDASCHLFGRTREDWGDARADELRFFDPPRLKECIDISLQRVMETLKAAEEKLRGRQRTLVRAASDVENAHGTVAKSARMRRLVDLACRVAKVDSTVLITGESGAGKERIARLVHDESTRAAGPFIAVNCGAIAETLLESELFGHAKGAFTGAVHERPGLFEAANTGTLFLDEVGDVSPGMQVNLLRAVQEREIRRVGESRTRRIDVRIVAATNRDLAQAVADGVFREDLYYRLKVVELHVPSLRERREDVLPLARILLADAAQRMKRTMTGLAPNVADQLLSYSWPGNVRELQNAMERAVALASGGRVELEDIPEEVRQAPQKPNATTRAVRPLEEIQRDYILDALARNDGNQTQTAAQLEIGSATLYRKLKRYGAINATKRDGRSTKVASEVR